MEQMLTPLKKYCDFKGRASRAEYWWFFLFMAILVTVATLVDVVLFGEQSLVSFVMVFATLLPSAGVAVRRFHDIDKSGWWVLLGLIPLLGLLVLLYFFVQPGTAGENRFGPDPRAGGAPATAAA